MKIMIVMGSYMAALRSQTRCVMSAFSHRDQSIDIDNDESK